jgi:2,5-diamino-6-(ribosylamino)-4(3H)-pyrimidinone 5'-phosphate reductase
MLPKVIIHNSISLDGSLTNFEPNMELHYRIAGGFKPDAHLIGSNTAVAGAQMYGGVPPEEEIDFEKPKREKSLPYWAIIDTRGALKGMLHTCRRFEYCKDVIVLISDSTPREYVDHLKERKYDFHVAGSDHVNLGRALQLISSEYGIKKVMTDTGRILGNLLLEQGLVSELSLLVHPVVVGNKSYPIFGNISEGLGGMKLIKSESYPKGLVWILYRVTQNKVGA